QLPLKAFPSKCCSSCVRLMVRSVTEKANCSASGVTTSSATALPNLTSYGCADMDTKTKAQATTKQVKPRSFAAQLIITTSCAWLYIPVHPVMKDGEVRLIAVVPAILAFCMAFDLGCRLVLHLARFLDWLSTRQPSGKEGTAHFAAYEDIKRELKK